MNQLYPYNSAIILTDADFITYGGETGTSTTAQRNAAYLQAEKRATAFIGSFLLPTTVTGTYVYNPMTNRKVVLDYAYVNSVNGVWVRSLDNLQSCTFTTTTACVFIREDSWGVLDMGLYGSCGCGGILPYQYEISYVAGLPTGIITQGDYLHALVVIADIALKEMLYQDMRNESMGDAGVTQYTNQDYSETRAKWAYTILGRSARARYAADILTPLRRKKALAL